MYLSLTEDQRRAIDAIENGDNVFITGSAGTGKSYLLQYMKQEYIGRGLHVTASTGIAAVNIGGVTLHSWAGIGLGKGPIEQVLKWVFSAPGSRLRRKLKRARMLAIDEISMISANTFELLDQLLQCVRENNEPFGGLQLILFGDFLQLPPVIKNYEAEDNFCFTSNSWKNARLKTVMLNKVLRQEDNIFVNLLNNMRFGRVGKEDLEILRSRYNAVNEDKVIRPTILVTHNRQVEEINNEELKNIPTEEKSFKAKFSGDKKHFEFLKKNCLALDELVLKEGAQVMMLKNTYAKDGVINGSLGVITGFSMKKGYPIVEFANGEIITVGPEDWNVEKINEASKEVDIVAKMTQIPLLLSWAITVHKSQGMSLDKIECDLGSAFAEGQVYVALSRVRTIEGLFIKSFNINRVKVNKEVVEFYQQLL